MDILILGAGMMGRAIAYDLANFSNFEKITLIDKNKKTLDNTKKFLKNKDINFKKLDVNN